MRKSRDAFSEIAKVIRHTDASRDDFYRANRKTRSVRKTAHQIEEDQEQRYGDQRDQEIPVSRGKHESLLGVILFVRGMIGVFYFTAIRIIGIRI